VALDGLQIQDFTSADGKKRCAIVQRSDGFFLYSEETFVTDDEREFGGGIYEYWTPTHFSGLFDTAAAAKADALGQLPWLRETTNE
jgi:hypothetical protein